MDYRKLIDDVIAQSQVFDLPSELQPQTFHIWKGDIDPEKDWDDFIGGQLVNHVYYDSSFKGGVDILNLTYGNTASSFYSLLTKNATIEIYTKEYIELDGAYISIGEDIDKKYLATSYRLDNFKLKDQDKEVFLGKIILVDIVKKMSEELDDTTIAPTINIANGKLGETIAIPKLKEDQKTKDISDIDVQDYEIVKHTNLRAKSIEFYFDKPAVIAAPDVIANSEGSPEYDKRIVPINANMKPKKFPINPWYCILPTQFAIPSFDNYGITHSADASNTAKIIAATQSVASVAQTGLSLSSVSNTLKGIGSAAVGLAQKFFGDKGALANSGAIIPQAVKASGDGLKFFIQGDSAGGLPSNAFRENGYMLFNTLSNQNDYIEINQANGEFGKYGKSMSPSNNGNFNSTFYFRALGARQIDTANRETGIPWLATPFATSGYQQLKINDKKIADYLKWGTPRMNIHEKDVLAPMIPPESWPFHVRCMFFRPDAYSFQQWPMIMPAEIGVYNVRNETSISYDTNVVDYDEPVEKISSFVFGGQSKNEIKSGKFSYWNKTITIDMLEQNNLYDPNKTFTSGRYEFDSNAFTQSVGGKFRPDLPQSLYQFQFFGFTDSIVQIKILDQDDNVIRHHKFNSQGKNVGTAAAALNVFQF